MNQSGSSSSPVPATTVVCVTYNRATMLREFLTSLATLDPAPERLVVVDNASSDDTAEVLAGAAELSGISEVIVFRESVNTGGAGGFCRGLQVALEAGAQWVWMMDDDVEVMPGALAQLHRWTGRFRCLQGRRDDVDGRPFRWQPFVHEPTMLPVMRRGAEFDAGGSVSINSGTFEGMLLHREVVERVGLPDPRFFLVWDDIVYGWLVSRHEPVGYVDEVVLRRKPKQRRVSVGDRRVNAGSARHRYYVVRNRALVRHYVRSQGALRPVAFAAGSALVAGKEVARMVLTERSLVGLRDLYRGWCDGRVIARDVSWRPVPAGVLTVPGSSEVPGS